MVSAILLCMLTVCQAQAATSVSVVGPVAEYSFGGELPRAWDMSGAWKQTADGARADGPSTGASSVQLPGSCVVEMVIEPSRDKSTAAILIGDGLKASVHIDRGSCKAVLSGVGIDGKDTVVETTVTMYSHQSASWSGRPVSLGLAIGPSRARMLVNGTVVAELTPGQLKDRSLSIHADGVVLKSVRVLRGLPERMLAVSGAGMGMLCAGSRSAPSMVSYGESMASSVLEVDGVPMLVQSGGGLQVSALDLRAEKYKSGDWSEGTGILTVPVPARAYSSAHILFYCDAGPGEAPAMGFGLRVLERSAADLRNIYVGNGFIRSSDEGVKVTPVPNLGRGWYLAKVALNPAALQWYTHESDGKLMSQADPDIAKRPVFSSDKSSLLLYLGRTWSGLGGVPAPAGKPSACQVAAITLDESGVDLAVQGNGLGNVFLQPDNPMLTATIRNLTSSAVTVGVTTQLIPYGGNAVTRKAKVRLNAGDEKSLDALAAPVARPGHYRVRVVADAGGAGRIDYRTNLALLPPATGKPNDMRFGCWSKLWEDFASDRQRDYLKEVAGVGFIMRTHNQDIRMGTSVPDDATAEKIAAGIGPDVKVFMLGWEQTWSSDQTFAFPRVIAEGKPEELPSEIRVQADKTADEWKRLAKAIRKVRPDVKLSLGNSAVNYAVPLLERGLKHGVDFDYFGTEEGLFTETPEEPADAIGNVSWWTKAVSEHFGFSKVPIFHSESVYYSTGPGFSRMDERTQAGNYVRTYALGFPYDSVFGMSGAMIDSGNRYIYTNWGMVGYCNQSPECSPKLSFVTYATFTRMVNGANYVGKLDTGTTSLYALHLTRPDGSPLYIVWNLRGTRRVTASLKAAGKAQVTDALGRTVEPAAGAEIVLEVSDLPIYLSGVEIGSIAAGEYSRENLPESALLSPLDDHSQWAVDTDPDKGFEAPEEWRGVPKVMGDFGIVRAAGPAKSGKAIEFSLTPLPGKHGLIPRYVSLRAKPGAEIAIPAGTTKLGIWMRGNSTWANVRFGVSDGKGRSMLLPKGDLPNQMTDNFDGWQFVRTGFLGEEIGSGGWKIDRLVVTMSEQQVYVDDLVTTPRPTIAICGLSALQTSVPDITYQPW